MDDVSLAATGIPDFSVFGWPYTGLVTLLTLVLYQSFGILVARMRRKHGVDAPAMHGPDELMRAFRVQGNTLEQLIIFLPLLWIAAFSLGEIGDKVAAVIGILWPASRLLYARGYMKDPKQRHVGFLIGILVLFALLGISLVQMVRSIIAWQ